MYTHVAYEDRKQRATLLTPELHVQAEACLTVHVTFFGGTDASLTIEAIGAQSTNQSQQLLRLRNGHNYWSMVEAELSHWVKRVAFVAHANVRTDGGLGIDDVSVVSGRCPGMFIHTSFLSLVFVRHPHGLMASGRLGYKEMQASGRLGYKEM